MSKFQDLIHQVTWNRQIFQDAYNNAINARAMLFNPRNSGVNVVIIDYVINNIATTNSNGTSSPIPRALCNGSGFGLFVFLPNSNGSTPGTSTSVGININTGAKGALMLNTDAAFPATPGLNNWALGQGQSDIQVQSSRSVREVIDLNETPIILAPGDSFGIMTSFAVANFFFAQVTYAQVGI
jgi:hypothetical protein